jgi:hypothetical protein
MFLCILLISKNCTQAATARYRKGLARIFLNHRITALVKDKTADGYRKGGDAMKQFRSFFRGRMKLLQQWIDDTGHRAPLGSPDLF